MSAILVPENRINAQDDSGNGDIVFVAIEVESIRVMYDSYGIGWPWPRSLYAYMTSFLKSADARVIAFDIIFSVFGTAYGAADDADFVSAIENSDNVIIALLLGAPPWDNSTPRVNQNTPFTMLGSSVLPETLRFDQAEWPDLRFAEAATAPGDVRFSLADDWVPMIPLLGAVDGTVVPTLGFAAYCIGSSAPVTLGAEPGLYRVDGAAVPRDDGGRITVTMRSSFPTYSAFDVIMSGAGIDRGEASVLDPSLFRDKYVFIGFTSGRWGGYRVTDAEALSTAAADIRTGTTLVPGTFVHMSLLQMLIESSR